MSSPKSQWPASSFVLLLVLLFNALASFNASFADYANDVNRDGDYFRFKTSDGTEKHEEAKLKVGEVLSRAGPPYEYEDNGYITSVTYIADGNGFRPVFQIRKKNENQPLGFLYRMIDPKLLESLAGGGLG